MIYQEYQLIPGREYCQIKSSTEMETSGWVIGENDIIAMSNKLGIVNVEVKGKFLLVTLIQ